MEQLVHFTEVVHFSECPLSEFNFIYVHIHVCTVCNMYNYIYLYTEAKCMHYVQLTGIYISRQGIGFAKVLFQQIMAEFTVTVQLKAINWNVTWYYHIIIARRCIIILVCTIMNIIIEGSGVLLRGCPSFRVCYVLYCIAHKLEPVNSYWGGPAHSRSAQQSSQSGHATILHVIYCNCPWV